MKGIEPSRPFVLELSSGRIIQIYDPANVATNDSNKASIGILRDNSVFEVSPTEHVISVSVGMHPVETERMRKMRENVEKRFGLSEKMDR